jgi:hypothetical protein
MCYCYNCTTNDRTKTANIKRCRWTRLHIACTDVENYWTSIKIYAILSWLFTKQILWSEFKAVLSRLKTRINCDRCQQKSSAACLFANSWRFRLHLIVASTNPNEHSNPSPGTYTAWRWRPCVAETRLADCSHVTHCWLWSIAAYSLRCGSK